MLHFVRQSLLSGSPCRQFCQAAHAAFGQAKRVRKTVFKLPSPLKLSFDRHPAPRELGSLMCAWDLTLAKVLRCDSTLPKDFCPFDDHHP